MYRPIRGLAAIAAATAVGITTRDAGFVVITFIGTLALPRILGLRGGHRAWGGCGHQRAHDRREERLSAWHRAAHAGGEAPPPAPAG